MCSMGGESFEGTMEFEECIDACKSKTTMFIFGQTPSSECSAAYVCNCSCQLNAFPKGACETKSRPHYDLFKIIITGKL